MFLVFVCLFQPRVAEEKSNELATINAEKDETIAKLKSQLFPVKPIQDFTPAEPNSELSICQ